MVNVLLLNSDRNAPTERLRALGVNLTVICPVKYAALYAGERHVGVSSYSALDEVLDAALLLAREEPIHAVVAATEKSVIAAAYVRTMLEISGQRLDSAAAFTHKGEMKRVLRNNGVRVARSLTVAGLDEIQSASDSLGWPVVVKPSLGSGGRGTLLLADRDRLHAFLAASEDDASLSNSVSIQVEEALDVVAEYHCDAVVRGGKVVFASVSRMFAPLISVDRASCAGSYLVKADAKASEIDNISATVIDILGLRDGVTHLECLATAEGVFAGEIASRPGGGAVTDVILASTGVDVWHELIQAEIGSDRPRRQARAADSATWGWTYLRVGDRTLEQLAAIPGVHSVRPDEAPGVAVAVMQAESEQAIIDIHARVVGTPA